MEKVVEYFHYWYRYRDSASVPDMDIPVELCLELLVAADFLGLDGKDLLPSLSTGSVADFCRLMSYVMGRDQSIRLYEYDTQRFA